jgi:hypothetical protein
MKKISNNPLFFLLFIVGVINVNQSMEKENPNHGHQQQNNGGSNGNNSPNDNQENPENLLLLQLEKLKTDSTSNLTLREKIHGISQSLDKLRKLKISIAPTIDPVIANEDETKDQLTKTITNGLNKRQKKNNETNDGVHQIDTRSVKPMVNDGVHQIDTGSVKPVANDQVIGPITGLNKRQKKAHRKQKRKEKKKFFQGFAMEIDNSLRKNFHGSMEGIIGENLKPFHGLTSYDVEKIFMVNKKPQQYITPAVINKAHQKPIKATPVAVNFQLIKNYFGSGFIASVKKMLPGNQRTVIIHEAIVDIICSIINRLINNNGLSLEFFKNTFQFFDIQKEFFEKLPPINGKTIVQSLQNHLFKMLTEPKKNLFFQENRLFLAPSITIGNRLQKHHWNGSVVDVPKEDILLILFFDMDKNQWQEAAQNFNSSSFLFHKTKQVFNNLSMEDLSTAFKSSLPHKPYFVDKLWEIKENFKFTDLYNLQYSKGFKKSLPKARISQRELAKILFEDLKNVDHIKNFFCLELDYIKKPHGENISSGFQETMAISDSETTGEKTKKSILNLFKNHFKTIIIQVYISYLQQWNSINQLIRQPTSRQKGFIFESQENNKTLDQLIKNVFQFPFLLDYILNNLQISGFMEIKGYKNNFLKSIYQSKMFNHPYKCNLGSEFHHCNPMKSQYKNEETRPDFLFASMLYGEETLDRPLLNIEATILQKSINSLDFFHKFITDFRDKYGEMLIEYYGSFDSCGRELPLPNPYQPMNRINWKFIFNSIVPQLKQKYPKAFLPLLPNGHPNKQENFVEIQKAHGDFIVNITLLLVNYLFEISVVNGDTYQKSLWSPIKQMQFRMVKELLISSIREMESIKQCTYNLNNTTHIKHFNTNNDHIIDFIEFSWLLSLFMRRNFANRLKFEESSVQTDLVYLKNTCKSNIKINNLQKTLAEIIALALKNQQQKDESPINCGVVITCNPFDNMFGDKHINYREDPVFPFNKQLINNFLENQYFIGLEHQGLYQFLRVVIQGKKQIKNHNQNRLKDSRKYGIKPKALLKHDESFFQIIMGYMSHFSPKVTIPLLRIIKKDMGLLND